MTFLHKAWQVFWPLGVGTIGGAVFYVLHTPLPWTLGALTAVALFAIFGPPFRIPALTQVARPVVGVLAGSAFTPAVVASVFGWWEAFVYVIAVSCATTVFGFLFFRVIGGLDRPTSFFASMPGGLGELSLIGDQFGGNVRNLVLIHSIRVISVVFTIPLIVQFAFGMTAVPLAARATEHAPAGLTDWSILTLCGVGGYILARYMKFPGGAVVSSMLLSALAHGFDMTQATPPTALVSAVQVVVGSIAGSRFVGIRWQEFGKLILLAAVWTILLLVFTGLAAFGGIYLFDRDIESMLLALAPGGIVEMTVVAYAFGLETAFVIACQVCRVFSVLTFAPIVGGVVFGRVREAEKAAEAKKADGEPD